MKHFCHWLGCGKEVPPRMWGCAFHWYKLPIQIRRKIWRAYHEGQEIEKNPSKEYLDAVREAREFIMGSDKDLIQQPQAEGEGMVTRDPEIRKVQRTQIKCPNCGWVDEDEQHKLYQSDLGNIFSCPFQISMVSYRYDQS